MRSVEALEILDSRGSPPLRTVPRDALIVDAAHEGQTARACGFLRALDPAGAVLGALAAA